ncbi:MAG: hypothetical protein KDB00_06240 [Planctomycetales bacterium]|nr:hypothetical protein [Planctomycetales bacterium]
MRLLLDGQFFGISQLDDAWYVFQRLSCWSGRIIRFTLSSEGMVDAMQVITRISPGCHQIDFLGRTLYITDTYNNRLLVYEQSGRRWNRISEHFPGGRLDRGRDSANYAHMNSIWRSDDGIWLMFHNETKKTGRNSELICVDSNHDVIERLSTNASNSHNLVRLDGRFLYCDSLRGALVHGDEIVYQGQLFTRGLAVTDNLVVVGQSQYGAREKRDQLGGSIAILDRNFKLLQQIETPGMVQDIRAVGVIDYAMSDTVAGNATTPSATSPVHGVQ